MRGVDKLEQNGYYVTNLNLEMGEDLELVESRPLGMESYCDATPGPGRQNSLLNVKEENTEYDKIKMSILLRKKVDIMIQGKMI